VVENNGKGVTAERVDAAPLSTFVLPERAPGQDSADPVVAAWSLMYDAVRTAFDDGVAAGALVAARAVERACTIGAANEDVPVVYSLALDMLLEAGDRQSLERITAPLLELPMGQRFRLLHAQLLRATAHMSAEPAAGLRKAVEAFERMGAAFWAARTGVELAVALAAAGDTTGSAAAAAAAEPLLRKIAAARALAQLDGLRGTTVNTPVG